ncbi:hypothetical protein PQX77_000666 [Marasmius sp. AFHP31]|nr:hypothetical protein PQX77_011069 [Marasmius sp. AFHP31]KAK1236076.1 hypothetical protein PQX77_000666 [Marasmius sp. AFHP31]
MVLPPRAYVFIGLNAVRILGIIAMLLVFSSNIVTLANDVKAVNRFLESNSTSIESTDYIDGSTVPNQPAGVFWAVLNRLLIVVQVLVLIMSELGWPSKFFNRFFPVLGKDFGLGALGVIQCLLGAAILSHRVDTFTLVSAFFMFSIGCLNILLGLIFRASAKSKRSVTSWKDHAKSALPTHVAGVDVRPVMNSAPPSFVSNMFKGDEKDRHSTASDNTASSRAGYGFGRQGEKAAAMKGYFISKPVESLPRYAPKPTANNGGD